MSPLLDIVAAIFGVILLVAIAASLLIGAALAALLWKGITLAGIPFYWWGFGLTWLVLSAATFALLRNLRVKKAR